MAATTSNSEAEADRRFFSYVLDYLIKRGMHETAEIFRKESRGVLVPAACSLPSEMNDREGTLADQLSKVVLEEANEGLVAPNNPHPGPRNQVLPTSVLQAPNYQQLCPDQMKTQDLQLLGDKFQGKSSFNNAMGPPEANNEGHNLAPLHGCPPNVPPSLLQAPNDQQRYLEMKIQALEARYQQLCLEMEAQLLEDNNSLDMKTQAQEARHQQLYLEMEAQALEAQLLGAQGFSSKNEVLSCHFSSDGKILASAGLERKVFIYNMETSNLLTTSEQHLKLIADVRFKPDSTIFATSSFDKTVKIWDAAKPSKSLFKLPGRAGLIMSLDFHPTEADILCSSDSTETIVVWNVNKRVMLKNFKGGKTQVRFQPRIGRYLATVIRTYINIIDTQSWSVVDRLDKGQISSVNSICWDTNGNCLASVSFESACVWSSASGQFRCIHELHSKGDKFQSCVFHPRYPNVLVIGSDKRLVLWNPESGQTRRIPAHNGSITGLAASTQNGKFASASRDHHVKLWK